MIKRVLLQKTEEMLHYLPNALRVRKTSLIWKTVYPYFISDTKTNNRWIKVYHEKENISAKEKY